MQAAVGVGVLVVVGAFRWRRGSNKKSIKNKNRTKTRTTRGSCRRLRGGVSPLRPQALWAAWGGVPGGIPRRCLGRRGRRGVTIHRYPASGKGARVRVRGDMRVRCGPGSIHCRVDMVVGTGKGRSASRTRPRPRARPRTRARAASRRMPTAMPRPRLPARHPPRPTRWVCTFQIPARAPRARTRIGSPAVGWMWIASCCRAAGRRRCRGRRRRRLRSVRRSGSARRSGGHRRGAACPVRGRPSPRGGSTAAASLLRTHTGARWRASGSGRGRGRRACRCRLGAGIRCRRRRLRALVRVVVVGRGSRGVCLSASTPSRAIPSRGRRSLARCPSYVVPAVGLLGWGPRGVRGGQRVRLRRGRRRRWGRR
ncbi:hypothetical protein C8R46DRAFT_1136464 [Mycena filopes]|nr:hypothetical protein C8R46DRAFT_1136464 [Mycena filopes]